MNKEIIEDQYINEMITDIKMRISARTKNRRTTEIRSTQTRIKKVKKLKAGKNKKNLKGKSPEK